MHQDRVTAREEERQRAADDKESAGGYMREKEYQCRYAMQWEKEENESGYICGAGRQEGKNGEGNGSQRREYGWRKKSGIHAQRRSEG
jgi:hypothetical protein